MRTLHEWETHYIEGAHKMPSYVLNETQVNGLITMSVQAGLQLCVLGAMTLAQVSTDSFAVKYLLIPQLSIFGAVLGNILGNEIAPQLIDQQEYIWN